MLQEQITQTAGLYYMAQKSLCKASIGQGSRFSAGYAISTDGGANWSPSQLIHGLLKMVGTTTIIGTPAPQAQYYFAEGYTGSGFSEYLTIVNPSTSTQPEGVTIRYLIQSGQPRTVVLHQPLQPGQRWTETANLDVGSNQQVSVVVSITGGTDVIGYSIGN